MTVTVPTAAPLRIGPLPVDPPVVLAPMAGVTDAPFRGVCSRFGAGLYVSEMITARALVERNAKTLSMLRFDDAETTRSVQLYGTDPRTLGEAVRFLVDEVGVDHVDMNFGCPVPKVTRKGGGSALPVRRVLLRNIVRAAVAAAGAVPVTIKFRMGVDDSILTYLDTGRIAEEEGVAAVALHARTAEQHYSGAARWEAIAALKAHVTTIPVLGNGDIWEAHDALGDDRPDRMRRRGRGSGLPRPPLAVPRPRRRLRRTPRAAAAAPRRGLRRDARPRRAARRLERASRWA